MDGWMNELECIYMYFYIMHWPPHLNALPACHLPTLLFPRLQWCRLFLGPRRCARLPPNGVSLSCFRVEPPVSPTPDTAGIYEAHHGPPGVLPGAQADVARATVKSGNPLFPFPCLVLELERTGRYPVLQSLSNFKDEDATLMETHTISSISPLVFEGKL